MRYNNWRKQEVHGWQTPASVYNNEKYFNKAYKDKLRKRPKVDALYITKCDHKMVIF